MYFVLIRLVSAPVRSKRNMFFHATLSFHFYWCHHSHRIGQRQTHHLLLSNSLLLIFRCNKIVHIWKYTWCASLISLSFFSLRVVSFYFVCDVLILFGLQSAEIHHKPSYTVWGSVCVCVCFFSYQIMTN